mmetsp:Transcript_47990/g.120131  ORF Transcript_47990/g.120131 Transcript_47990/m.120131 type:complete len:157 (-) Transcript_47990:767-1237(-)
MPTTHSSTRTNTCTRTACTGRKTPPNTATRMQLHSNLKKQHTKDTERLHPYSHTESILTLQIRYRLPVGGAQRAVITFDVVACLTMAVVDRPDFDVLLLLSLLWGRLRDGRLGVGAEGVLHAGVVIPHAALIALITLHGTKSRTRLVLRWRRLADG